VSDIGTAHAPKLTAYDLREAVRARYEPPEWHLEHEVTLAGRRLDLVALNLWAARKFRIVGFEIKVSRGDWMRELAAFQKAEEWTAVVDAFYVVTPPKLVRHDELPAAWGLLELCGSRLMTRRHAQVREGSTTIPREVAVRFIGRLAQRDTLEERQARERARMDLSAEIEKKLRGQLDASIAEERRELDQFRAGYRELFDVLGIRSTDWRAHERALRAAGIFARATAEQGSLRRRLENAGEELRKQATLLLEASKQIEREAEL
jgi:hypothetical protein